MNRRKNAEFVLKFYCDTCGVFLGYSVGDKEAGAGFFSCERCYQEWRPKFLEKHGPDSLVETGLCRQMERERGGYGLPEIWGKK